MQERLKELPKKFLEYWNKWTSKQKTIVVSIVSGVILLIGILVFVLGRTKYVDLYTYTDTRTASNVVTLLQGNSIATKLASDNLTVRVDEKRYSEAIMAVSTSDLADSSFGIDGLLDTSITTTNWEHLQRLHILTEEKLLASIKIVNGVQDARINYFPKDTSNRILTVSQEIPVSVILVTTEEFNKKKSSETIAKMVAAAVGNQTTDNVKILNQKGELLYDGPKDEEEEIDITDKMAVRQRFQDAYIEMVKGALLMNGFTEVNVAPYLDINFDRVKEMFTDYLPLEGEDRGVLTELDEASSKGTNGIGDIPGTDSNDENDYMLVNGQNGEYQTSKEHGYYQPSVHIRDTVYDTGTLSVENSSIAVTARRIITRTEEELELRGELENTTFAEYVSQHSEPVQRPTDEQLIEIIAVATGIPARNVRLITYDVYEFVPKQEVARNWTFYLQILLAVLLVAFLLFVVFRGMAPVEVTDLEPELSIETLLATTKENQSLEDVEFNEQSETRKMIEKFFDENPEAVAQLLRNWLNSDWE